MALACGVKVRFIHRDTKLRDFLIRSDRPVVAQFHNMDCPYCVEEGPEFIRLSHEYCANAWFAKVDCANLSEETLEVLEIEALPLIVVYKNGQEVARHEGMARFDELSEFLGPHL